MNLGSCGYGGICRRCGFWFRRWLFYVGQLLICVGWSSRPPGGYFLLQRTNTLSVSIRSFSVSMRSFSVSIRSPNALIQRINTLISVSIRSFSVSIRSPNALIQRTNTLISVSIRSPASLRRGRRGHAHSVLRRGRRGYAPTAYKYAPQRIHTLHSVFIRSTAHSYAHTALWRR